MLNTFHVSRINAEVINIYLIETRNRSFYLKLRDQVRLRLIANGRNPTMGRRQNTKE